MRKYTVQWAYAKDIGTPVIHRDEAMARGEVAHLLGTWVRRGLEDYLNRIDNSPERELYKRYPDLEEGIRYVAPAIKRLMQEGLVWDAYDLWEEFYQEFEHTIGMPLYVMTATVIVRGTPETGMKNRLPLIEPLDVSPEEKYLEGPYMRVERTEELKMQMLADLVEVVKNKASLKRIPITGEQFVAALEAIDRRLQGKYPYMDEESEAKYIAELREGILRKLFPKLSGASLGALQRWLVQYADFGGTWHPSRHTNEEMAKGQAKEYLSWLLHHLSSVASMEAHVDRNLDFVAAAEELDAKVRQLMAEGRVWAAYLEYKEFEEIWSTSVGTFPLQQSIGTMRVVPTPEPEA